MQGSKLIHSSVKSDIDTARTALDRIPTKSYSTLITATSPAPTDTAHMIVGTSTITGYALLTALPGETIA